MTHTYKVSGMTCNGCAATVEKVLKQIAGVTDAKVNLNKAEVEITMQKHISTSALQSGLAAYPSYQLSENDGVTAKPLATINNFWQDRKVWSRASLNTLNCLIGCSIGDFGMIIYLQAFYPNTSMIMQTILATIAGLMTSVLLETILLHSREKFSWAFAFQTAISMSFLSMVAMELAMNATDFMITGGKASFDNPMYWTALIIALVAGFLAPLPYNYYKLKKFNKACH
jgi:copper chaperone CopZ